MILLQQVPGIRYIGAFTLVAFVEAVHCFEIPRQFVDNIGLIPSLCVGGEKEGQGSLSHYGRRDLKALFVEAAQTVLRSDSPMARWAKPRNVTVCALARKRAVLCWHVLMGHSAPECEGRPATEPKPYRLARTVGREVLQEAGYTIAPEYVIPVLSTLYAHLPTPPPNPTIT